VYVVELGAHHRAEDTTPAVRRIGADDGDSCGRDGRSGNRGLKFERTGPADDAAVLMGSVHALERQVLREALQTIAARLEREVLPDREQRLGELVEVRAGSDLERQTIFSSGA
jgi:hypothetical protein